MNSREELAKRKLEDFDLLNDLHKRYTQYYDNKYDQVENAYKLSESRGFFKAMQMLHDYI